MSKPGAIDSPVSYDALLKEDEMADEQEVSRRVSRKDFVKGAAALAGVGALASCAPGGTPGPAGTPVPCPTCAPAEECAPRPTPWIPATWDKEADVVIVGYGGAGAAAAITAHDSGAEVLVLEKMPKEEEGGNSRVCGGWFLSPLAEKKDLFRQYLEGMDPLHQAPAEFHDAAAMEMCNNEEWVQGLGGVITSVTESAEWADVPGGLDSNRMMKAEGHIWNVLAPNVEDREIQILHETPGKRLIQDPISKEILGIVAESGGEEINIKAKRGVILTCGSFEYNEDMHNNYASAPCFYHGTPGNTGDGIRMAQAVGADLWHMNDGHMYGDVNAILVPEYDFPIEFVGSYPGNKGFRVDKYGERFMNEDIAGNHGQSNSILKRYDKQNMIYPMIPCYFIFDDDLRASKVLFRDTMDWVVVIHGYRPSEGNLDEIEKGWLLKADTITELGQKILALKANEGRMDPALLEETFNKYNRYCQDGNDPDFGRSAETLIPLDTPPFYAAEVYPGSRNTQGGPRRDAKARIVDTWGNPIPRLYSAGELGSMWVRSYQGAGNVGECLAFGRIAARNAAAETAWA